MKITAENGRRKKREKERMSISEHPILIVLVSVTYV
jgi:hypothetical protein